MYLTVPTHLRYLQKGKKTKVGGKEIEEEDKKGQERQEGRKERKEGEVLPLTSWLIRGEKKHTFLGVSIHFFFQL